jgi:hypothetical protein
MNEFFIDFQGQDGRKHTAKQRRRKIAMRRRAGTKSEIHDDEGGKYIQRRSETGKEKIEKTRPQGRGGVC